MRWMICVCLAVIAAAPVPAMAQKKKAEGGFAYPPQLPGARVEVYKAIGSDLKLNAYVYEPPGRKPADKRPAIVFFFGGGWSSGSPKQFEQHCRYLASRGMVAITADYRVATRHQAKVVDCIRDANSAIRWARANAAKLGIEPDRIAAAGGSAGGHLAAATATLNAVMEPNEDGSISSVPNALVLYNPAVALAPFVDSSKEDSDQLKGIRERFGAEPQTVSPAHNVRKGMPPTIMFFGTADKLLVGAQYMERQMKEAGGKCEIATYESQAHGFFNFGRGDNKHFLDTLKKTDEFLRSLGWLSGADSVDSFDWSVR